LKEDIREECEKLGDVTNVVLYDKEEDGIVSVRFANAESAKACVGVMHGRFFDGQRVEAYIFDGLEKFKKTSIKKTVEEEEAEQERLEKVWELAGGEWRMSRLLSRPSLPLPPLSICFSLFMSSTLSFNYQVGVYALV